MYFSVLHISSNSLRYCKINSLTNAFALSEKYPSIISPVEKRFDVFLSEFYISQKEAYRNLSLCTLIIFEGQPIFFLSV